MNALKRYLILAGIVMLSNSNAYTKEPRIGNSFTGTTWNMSRKQAEKSLDSLARKIIWEDAWVHDGKKLIDIGDYEDRWGLVLSYEVLNPVIQNAKGKDTITLYHIHTNSYYGTRFNPAQNIDILLQSWITEKNKGTVIISKLFDGRGMWEFSADQELIDKMNVVTSEYYKARKVFRDLGKHMKEMEHKDMWDHNNPGKPKKNRSHIPDQYDPIAVEEYISALKAIGITLKYTPSERIQ